MTDLVTHFPKVGDAMPDLQMTSDEGKPVKLSDYRGKKVILYFYPQDFTSGCELQACHFRDSYAEIEAKDGVVLGVSPDDVESHRKFREALNLPFHLLVDQDFAASKALNCFTMRANPDGSETPRTRRGQYVIGEDGKIVDIQTPVTPADSLPLALAKL